MNRHSALERSDAGRPALSWRYALLLGLPSILAAPGSAHSQTDPFAQPPATTATDLAARAVESAAGMVAGCEQLTRELCEKSNTSLLASSAGYVLVSVLLFSMLRAWWNRRGTASAAVRFFVPMLLAAAVAGALVAFDPARGQDLKCCLAHGVFKAEVLLQDSTAGRTALFGVLPTAALFTLVAFIRRLARG